MIFSLLIVVFLSSVTVVHPTCSGDTKSICESGGECFWTSGVCKALEGTDCQPGSCPAGCVYQAAVPTTCVDSVAESCATFTDAATCLETICKVITAGQCSLSETLKPASCEAVDYACPGGCQYKGESVFCVTRPLHDDNCAAHSTVALTECTQGGSCKWENNQCVPKETGMGFCEGLTNNVVSECSNSDGFCGVNGEACILFMDSWDQLCNELTVEECVEGSDGVCTVKNGGCKLDLDQLCSDSDPDDCDGVCKPGPSSTCVFNTDYCIERSTDSISDCSDSSHCKVSSNNCIEKSPAEECSTKSVVKYSECEERGGCKVQGENCVNNGGSGCSVYSVERTVSECSESNYVKCEINSEGRCVPFTPNCRLNAAGTGCDPNNRPNDKCEEKYGIVCGYVDCNQLGGTTCNSFEVNGVSAGCLYDSAVTSCVSKWSPLNCAVNAGGTCNDASCTRREGTPASCVVGSVTDAICSVPNEINACGGIVGCKWSSSEGTCVEKNCSNSASYTTCCGSNPSCEYCTASPKPSDCPSACTTTPSYSNCCTSASCVYCTTDPKPDDCPGSNGGSNMYSPFLLLIAVLFIGWL